MHSTQDSAAGGPFSKPTFTPRASSTLSTDIPVWTVTVDGRAATFDDMDVALAYLRGDVGTNGTPKMATFETRRMDPLRYAAEVEREEGGVIDELT